MQALIAQIQQANAEGQQLQIAGAQTKRHAKTTLLELTNYTGVVNYAADELVITVKAGTKLAELQQILAANKQSLAFEPPDYGGSTIGGTYACGLTGSAQPFRGSLRDYVLGVKIINGLGQVLRFGGESMKNVAGYDVARLLVGSQGKAAVIAEISLKVLPITSEQTYVMLISESEAIQLMNQWAGTNLPLSACAYYQEQFFYRLIGQHPQQHNSTMDANIWQQLNPFTPILKSGQNLWRLHVPSTTPRLDNTLAVDWCGNRRWISSKNAPICEAAQTVELWHKYPATLINTPTSTQLKIQQGLQQVFDPNGVFV